MTILLVVEDDSAVSSPSLQSVRALGLHVCRTDREVVKGEWNSTPSFDGDSFGGQTDRFNPTECGILDPGYDADGKICSQLQELQYDALVFVGDSLAANLMIDLRESFFGEMTSEERPFGRTSCWVGRKSNFYGARGVCHDGLACNDKLRVSWIDAARPDNRSASPPDQRARPVMREALFKFLDEMPQERVAIVIWFGIHYLAHPLPDMNISGDLGAVLRFLNARIAKFPFVIVLGSPGISRKNDNTYPYNIDPTSVEEMSEALQSASLAANAFFLDVLALRKGRGETVNPQDGIHPDELLDAYINSMILTLLGVN